MDGDNMRASPAGAATLALPGLPPERPSTAGGLTYILVHGGFHGGWCWRETAGELRRRGHLVFTPTLTGAGERSHLISRDITLDLWVQDILNVIHFERLNDVVLVGHSFAGLTLAGVADRAPSKLRHLVFLDALLVETGQSAFDARPQAHVDAAVKLAQQTSGGISVPPPALSALGLTDPRLVDEITPLLTPHPLSAYSCELMLRNPLTNGVRSTYIVCSDPAFALLEPSHVIARKAGSAFKEIKTGHEAMLTMPAELAQMLDDLGQFR